MEKAPVVVSDVSWRIQSLLTAIWWSYLVGAAHDKEYDFTMRRIEKGDHVLTYRSYTIT